MEIIIQMEAQNKLVNKTLFILALLGLMSCSARKYLNNDTPKKIEIVINDVSLELDGSLINNFITDFQKSKTESKKYDFPNVVSLNIYYNNMIQTYQSDGMIYLYNNEILISPKENLIKKYWDIDEENIMIISKPQPLNK